MVPIQEKTLLLVVINNTGKTAGCSGLTYLDGGEGTIVLVR